jgi:hypothetical protein
MISDNKDIRWKQRFSNYKKALSLLRNLICHMDSTKRALKKLNDLIDHILRVGKVFYKNEGN